MVLVERDDDNPLFPDPRFEDINQDRVFITLVIPVAVTDNGPASPVMGVVRIVEIGQPSLSCPIGIHHP